MRSPFNNLTDTPPVPSHQVGFARRQPDLESPGPTFFAESASALSTSPAATPPSTIEAVLDAMLVRQDGRPPGAQDIRRVVALRERLFHASEYINPYADGEAVIALESVDPLVVCGGWIAQLIERAGARHPLNPTRARERAGAAIGPQHGERDTPAPRPVSPQELITTTPSRLILIPREGAQRSARELAQSLITKDWFPRLTNLQTPGSIALVDHAVHQPGPLVIDFYEWLVWWLHACPLTRESPLVVELLA